MLLALVALAVVGCATSRDAPQGSSPADKLRKADDAHHVEGELQVTVSRTR
jgi:hypothetical protein